jgi:hypothetical protein
MPKYRGVEYAIRPKGGWEWEVFARSPAVGVVSGTLTSNSQNLVDDAWRQLAVDAARAAIELLIKRGIVSAAP